MTPGLMDRPHVETCPRPHPDFAETIPGLLVAELDDLPPEALDLEEVVREAEGRAQ